MQKLVISDLNFCELATEVDIKGGNARSIKTQQKINPYLNIQRKLLNNLVGYTSQGMYSDSNVTVEKINNRNGESGILVSSKNGNYKTAVISSPKSSKSFGVFTIKY
jgi:hypothetical protein